MIFITGDCHGKISKFTKENFPEQENLTKDDYVIICGDFGCIWNATSESPSETLMLDELNNKPFTTLFVDGNHENFQRLYTYPETVWNNGRIHKIRDSVFHLIRGQVFNIDDFKFFTFGGARSHDINNGVLNKDDPLLYEKMKILNSGNALYRIKNVSWWEEEMPNKKEYKIGIHNLSKNNYEVDYIITHCCPTNLQKAFYGYEQNELTDYFEYIKEHTKFKAWFFGHYHKDKVINKQFGLIYNAIIRIT